MKLPGKPMKQGNLFAKIPADLSREVFDSLVESARVRIERIISKGHTSPDSGWYDQDLSEWVVILRGEASITFDNGETVELAEGDYIEIPSHKKHKVTKTSPKSETIWLAVHF